MRRLMTAILWRYLAARWRWVLFPLGLWVVTRISLLLLGYVSLTLTPGLRGSSSASLHAFPALDALCCWDCGWFDRLARLGYQNVNETNFWPGLPMAARLLMRLTGMRVGFALLTISNLACLGSYLTIYQLFVRLDGAMAAQAALVLFAAYPFAFFQASGYPETIMIFTSALALSLAMSRRHVLAGLALGLWYSLPTPHGLAGRRPFSGAAEPTWLASILPRPSHSCSRPAVCSRRDLHGVLPDRLGRRTFVLAGAQYLGTDSVVEHLRGHPPSQTPTPHHQFHPLRSIAGHWFGRSAQVAKMP